MIESLITTKFRGIKKGKLKLSPITILLGPNNSAKSTILEAMFLAPNPCRKVPYADPLRYNQYSALEALYSMHQTIDYRGYIFLLHNYISNYAEIGIMRSRKDKYFLRFIREGNRILIHSSLSEVLRRNKGIYHIEDEEISFFAEIYSDQLGVHRVLDSKPFIEETLLVSSRLLKSCYEYLRQQWTMIVNSKIARRAAVDASKFSPENYRDFTMEPVIGGHLDIEALLEDGRRIRLGDLGEGIQTYATTRMLYELVNPKVLLWDDIESHLNPRMLLHIANWFNELLMKKKQIIISTHSLEAAKIIAGVNEEQTRICLTSLEESILRTKILTLSDLEALQTAGIDARTAEAFLL